MPQDLLQKITYVTSTLAAVHNKVSKNKWRLFSILLEQLGSLSVREPSSAGTVSCFVLQMHS